MKRHPVLHWIMMMSTLAQAREYVVSPDGDDAGPGTTEAPFRTLSRAAAVMTAGDRCTVREGTYRETLRPAASGTADAPIVFRAAAGETVILSGTEPVTVWTQSQDNVWQAPLPWSLGKNNQLFVGGRMGTEARWPNRTTADLLEPEGAAVTRGGTGFIVCDDLPERPDDYWNGAVIWCLAGAKWTSWTSVVTGYQAGERKLIFTLEDHGGSITRNMNPGDRRGATFYLCGIKGELDSPGEWYLDDDRETLFLATDGPRPQNVEMKRRQLAVDLAQRRHIHVEGFQVHAATVRMADAEHCLLKGLRARYLSHTRGGRTGYSLYEETGIVVSGQGNTVRDCELAYSVGDGIKLGGERNAVINCWIHDMDYSGSYGAPVKCWGTGHLISHNTVHDTGRDCMQPAGQAHIIQYNNIFNMGRIAHDLGATYVCGHDGGGTEFRYNWCHDNRAAGTRMGIYLDNFTSNYFVHHNLCWNIRGDAVRLNKPSLYNVVVNNTLLDVVRNWGRWKSDWMYGCIYANNAVRATIQSHPQIIRSHNVEEIPDQELTHQSAPEWTEGRDRGVPVQGITPPGDDSPDVGAYRPGEPGWTAGHDFDNPPDPRYELTDTPLRNLVRHGSFDWVRWRGALGPWQGNSDTGIAVIHGPGGISASYTTRNTIIGHGLKLDGGAAVAQAVTGLRPNQPYELTAWVKLEEGARLRLGIEDWGADNAHVDTAARDGWHQLRLRVHTGAEPGQTARVTLVHQGSGTAYADDVALVGTLPHLEPHSPGPVPVPDN